MEETSSHDVGLHRHSQCPVSIETTELSRTYLLLKGLYFLRTVVFCDENGFPVFFYPPIRLLLLYVKIKIDAFLTKTFS